MLFHRREFDTVRFEVGFERQLHFDRVPSPRRFPQLVKALPEFFGQSHHESRFVPINFVCFLAHNPKYIREKLFVELFCIFC